MTNKEAIKYLQQLYPNGGHCWLDEQRIEAIGMAIKALQEETVSEDLDSFAIKYAQDKPYPVTVCQAVKVGANWQKTKDQSTIELAEDNAMLAGMEKMKEEMMAKAIDAQCFGFQGGALFSFRLPASNYLIGSEVKVIVIKK